MSQLKRFEKLHGLANGEAEMAGSPLAGQRLEIEQKETELQRLMGYLQDYRQESTDADGALDTARWTNRQTFIGRLEAVIAEQRRDLEQATAAYHQEVERWRESYRRAQVLENVVDQLTHSENNSRDRREQREVDDLCVEGRNGPDRPHR